MIVDAHAHCTPVAFSDLAARLAPARVGEPYPTYHGGPPPPRTDTPADVEGRLALMDEAGVQMQVLSQPTGPYFANAADAVQGARLRLTASCS